MSTENRRMAENLLRVPDVALAQVHALLDVADAIREQTAALTGDRERTHDEGDDDGV